MQKNPFRTRTIAALFSTGDTLFNHPSAIGDVYKGGNRPVTPRPAGHVRRLPF